MTDRDAGLRERLLQVLFKQGKFQWSRLENLIKLAGVCPVYSHTTTITAPRLLSTRPFHAVHHQSIKKRVIRISPQIKPRVERNFVGCGA